MKLVKKLLIILISLLAIVFCYLFVGKAKEQENITWGVVFSQKHSSSLGLNWKENYLALLGDLGVRKIKTVAYWDLIESEKGNYVFDDLDWQISEANKRDAKIVVAVGMKAPRWPECHIPSWAVSLDKEQQQERILGIIEKTVLRYSDNKTIVSWQVENEPFFPFGNCPWYDKDFLIKEVNLVRSLSSKPVMVTDTGEYSLWMRVSKIGDITGVTMYRKAWFDGLKRYFNYHIPPVSYYRKAKLIEFFFGKEVICTELQAEPWGPALLYDISVEEMDKTMNLNEFKKTVEFARQAGLKEFHFWGAEWWYYMKEKQGRGEIWQEAKKLFNY